MEAAEGEASPLPEALHLLVSGLLRRLSLCIKSPLFLFYFCCFGSYKIFPIPTVILPRATNHL
jgi:hypothetical protein